MNPRKFHALLALPAAVILSWLLFTGLFMNHSHDLRLDKQPLPDTLLFLLRAKIPENTFVWQLQDAVLSQVSNTLFWANRELGEVWEPVVFSHPYGWLILGKHQLLLLDHEGLEITRIPLPDKAIHLASQQPIQVVSETGCFELSEDFSSWRQCRSPAPAAQHFKPTPKQAGRHAPAYAQWKISHALTWEQFLLKAHNLSILGTLGKWVLDGLALYLIAFMVAGVLIRLKSIRR